MNCGKTFEMINKNKKEVASELVNKFYTYVHGKSSKGLNTAYKAEMFKHYQKAISAKTLVDAATEKELRPTKVMTDLDTFVDYITNGVYKHMTELESDNGEAITQAVTDNLKTFSSIIVNLISTEDYEQLKNHELARSGMKAVKSMIGMEVMLKKNVDAAESWITKILRFDLVSSDRAKVFASHPFLSEAYLAKKQLASMSQSAANYGLEMKSKLVNDARGYGMTEENLGTIINTLEDFGLRMNAEKAEYEALDDIDKQNATPPKNDAEILTEAKSLIEGKFSNVTNLNSFTNASLELWKQYKAFNYGFKINEGEGASLFGLPEGYRPMDPSYEDGYLPKIVRMNIARENWINKMGEFSDVNTNSELLKEITGISKQFKQDENGDIGWKWMKNYFPHHSNFEQHNIIGNDKVIMQSADDATAFYQRNKPKTNRDIEFSNDLETTIQNIRYRSNMAIDKLFTAYVASVTGYSGDKAIMKDVIHSGERSAAHNAWVKANNSVYNSSLKDYVNGMSKRFERKSKESSNRFRVARKLGVGVLSIQASMPLAGSSIGNLIGAGSAGMDQLGVTSFFKQIAEYEKKHPAGTVDEYVQRKIRETEDMNLGVKAIRFAEEDTIIDKDSYSILEKSLDKFGGGMIKSGEHIMRHGLMSPITVMASAAKGLIKLSLTTSKLIHSKEAVDEKNIGRKRETFVGKIDTAIELTGDKAWASMSGSERLLLKIQSMTEYDKTLKAVKLKNTSLINNNKEPMKVGTKELDNFIENYRNSTLHTKEVLNNWKNIVGDFTEDTKPFWAWATLRDAESIDEVLLGTMATSYYMFKQVGLFLTQNTFRTVGKSTASILDGEYRVGMSSYALAIAGLTLLDMFTEEEGGMSTPLTNQINPASAVVDPAMSLIKAIGSVWTGAKMSENEYTKFKYSITRGLGGMPFGGTAQQLWDGYEEGHTALAAAKNVINDIYDPVYMLRTFMEQVATDTDDLDLIPKLKKEYKKNGIPILQQITAQNKTFDRIIDMVGIASKTYSTQLGNLSPSDKNKLSYSASQDWSKFLLGLMGSMPFVNKAVDDTAYSLKDMLALSKGDEKTRIELGNMLGDLTK